MGKRIYMPGDLVNVYGLNKKFTYEEAMAKYSEDDVFPIELTEQILLDNGFEPDSSFSVTNAYFFPKRYEEINNRGFRVEKKRGIGFFFTDHSLIEILYVHQFQQVLRLMGFELIADNMIKNMKSDCNHL